jgi:3',5'-cyclic AMP phosphodiesterase CpdA
VVLAHLNDMMGSEFPYPTAVQAAHGLVEAINQYTDLDFVLHTGDITNYGSPDEFEMARALFNNLRVPVYFLNGNHDNVEALYGFLGLAPSGEPYHHTFEVNGVRFICLDSATGGQGTSWKVSPTSLQWLEAQMAASQQPTIVAIHHPPFKTGEPLHDLFVVTNYEEVHQTLRKGLPQVKGVLSGHIHTHMDYTRDGLHYSVAVAPFSRTPGYAVVSVFEHGMMVERHSYLPSSQS